MTYHVIVKNRAFQDIERNSQWWAEHHSTSQALRWHEAAFDAIYKLDTFPDSHPIADENDAFAYEIRELHFGTGSRPTHRAIFTIKGDEVHVLTVRSAARDAVSTEELDD